MRLSYRVRLTLLHVSFFVLIEVLLALGLYATFGGSFADAERRGLLTGLLAIGLPASAVATSLVAWVLAGLAQRPLRKLAEQARELGPGQLDAQLDVEDASGAVAALQDELNRALTRLEEGYEAQAHFVGNVAHELKTPIAVMLAETQVLLSRPRAEEEYAAFAAHVETDLRTLGRLVESFLIVSRAERGEGLTRRLDVHLPDVLLEAIEHCAGYAELSGVRLEPRIDVAPDVEGEIVGDPDLLRTMLDNLIRNAVRYSPTGECVDVALRCGATEAVFHVRDRGPGIPEDALQSIFRRFEQAESGNSRSEGTGLGLNIASSVARLHGGRIEVENEPDRGCRFRVVLPLGSGAPEDTPKDASADA